jgi:hypothetical protein
MLTHLGYIREDGCDLQHLIDVQLYLIPPIHHFVSIAGNFKALSFLGQPNIGNVGQTDLPLWL